MRVQGIKVPLSYKQAQQEAVKSANEKSYTSLRRFFRSLGVNLTGLSQPLIGVMQYFY